MDWSAYLLYKPADVTMGHLQIGGSALIFKDQHLEHLQNTYSLQEGVCINMCCMQRALCEMQRHKVTGAPHAIPQRTTDPADEDFSCQTRTGW